MRTIDKNYFENYKKRRAAFCTLVNMVDANNGKISVNYSGVKRIYNDQDLTVWMEFDNGKKSLLADVAFEILDGIINHFKDNGQYAYLLLPF